MKLILRIVETLVFYLVFIKKVLKSSSYGTNFPIVSDRINNLYIRTSLLSERTISGKLNEMELQFITTQEQIETSNALCLLNSPNVMQTQLEKIGFLSRHIYWNC